MPVNESAINYPTITHKECRSRSFTPSPPHRGHCDDYTNSVLDKFMDILNNMKGRSTTRFTLNNVVPEFDPMSKE
jgi:hypothetical protein